MKAKGEDDLSGLEYFAWTCFQEKSTEWIPIGDSLYLGKIKKLISKERKLRKKKEVLRLSKNRSKTWKLV